MSLRAFNPYLPIVPAAGIVVVALLINAPRDKCLAAAGAMVAVLGLVAIGRPVIRLGYRGWRKKMSVIGGGSYRPTPEEIEEGRQDGLDAKAIQFTGPGLAAFGTLLNGFSGFAS